MIVMKRSFRSLSDLLDDWKVENVLSVGKNGLLYIYGSSSFVQTPNADEKSNEHRIKT